MPKGLSKVKKNIEKESIHYFVKHKTYKFIQKLAEKDERTVGGYLDQLAEREARKNLTQEEIDMIIVESNRMEEERRAQAEQMLAEQAKS
jgi:predicted solute-binding protein